MRVWLRIATSDDFGRQTRQEERRNSVSGLR